MIELSVIIPCFNAEDTIDTLLNHLGRQTLTQDAYEVIVVDDGSSDQTLSIVKSHSWVKLIEQTNAGPGVARMKGVTQAKGKYLLFLDADLDIGDNLLEKHLSFHKQHQQVAATGGSVLPNGDPKMFSWQLVDHLCSWFNAHPHVIYMDSPEYLPSLNFCVNKEIVFDQHQLSWADGLKHTGEDVIFCYDLRSRDLQIRFIPDAPVRHSDRRTFRGYMKHMYRWGYHAPFVRGRYPGLKYGFLFPPRMISQMLMLPLIIGGYTMFIWKCWWRSRFFEATFSLPQIFVGRFAYAAGVVKGTRDKKA